MKIGKKLIWKASPGGVCLKEGAISGTVNKPWVCTRVSGNLKWLSWGNAHLTPVLISTTTLLMPTRTTVAPTRITFLPTTTTVVATTTTVAPHICSDVGVCNLGDVGPGGGIVFYDAGSSQSWGRYIEVSRKELLDANGVPAFLPWTAAMDLAKVFVSGGKSDWRLPTKDELNSLYLRQDLIPGHSCHSCWSSTEQNGYQAWALEFSDGNWFFNTKLSGERIRLVRVFG